MRIKLVTAVSLYVLVSSIAVPSYAQTVNDSIIGTVQMFFDAMAAGDADATMQVMVMDGQYHRVLEDDGGTSIRRVSFAEYVNTLGNGTGALLERMWNPTVLHHGAIAVVWTDYDFYRDERFSHCGVDAFQLIRTADGWKISGIVYTVEREDCPPSPLGPPGEQE